MEDEASTVAQVERLEDYCLRKRCLEADIEVALGRRDEKAVERIELAEIELENTKRECADVMARVKVALQGNFERAENTGLHSETRRNDLLIAPEESVFPTATNASSNMDTSTSTDPQNRPKSADHFEEDDSSDEFLTLLVQRYIDICHERRLLQEEIEDTLERKERGAEEKLKCAKIMLETTRRKALEIMAVLNEVGGGDAKISFPAGDIDPLGSRPPSVGVEVVSESSFRTTTSSPQQDVRYRPPYARGSSALNSPHLSNSSLQSSSNGTRGPPVIQPRAQNSQRMARPPMSQQLMPPPPNMPGMPRGMSSGPPVGAPRVLGQAQAPQFVSGPGPHHVNPQVYRPPMLQQPRPYYYNPYGNHHGPNIPRHF